VGVWTGCRAVGFALWMGTREDKINLWFVGCKVEKVSKTFETKTKNSKTQTFFRK
jgi:hypothetical protein